MQKLGKYEIVAELGHGAMGVVYKARDPLIGRLVALKTINSNLVDRPDLLERFYQEAQSAGRLQHPNIVTIFELGKADDTPFIAMEYLDGESLEKSIGKRADLPLALKLGYVVRICQALEYAHKNRVVHRDVKPANIMVNSDGVVKVVDFGIARLIDFSRTHTNMMIGTPAYMAPELFNQKKADERTDIWAVGVTFYELICSQRPFAGEAYGLIRSINEDDFSSPSSISPECPAELDAVIRKMLQKDRGNRYQSMEDVLMDLEPIWNRMRTDAVNTLLESARRLFDSKEFTKARDTALRARHIDTSNKDVRSLLEKASAAIQRSDISKKIQHRVNRAKSFLQSRNFREAQTEAQAALELDSQSEPAKQIAAEVAAALHAQTQRDRQERIQDIRLKINRQELTDAAELARRTLVEFGPDTDVTQLLQSVQVELQSREQKRAQEQLDSSPRPLSPTDVNEEPLISGPAFDSSRAATTPSVGPKASVAAPALASAKSDVQPYAQVLTPPPALQSQISAGSAEKKTEPVPLPTPVSHRRFTLSGKYVLAAAIVGSLVAGGVAYRYFKSTAPKSQPQSTQPSANETELKPIPTPPAPTISDAAIPPPTGVAGSQSSENALSQGIQDFNRRNFTAAKTAFNLAVARAPQNWDKRTQAADYLHKTEIRLQQEQHWKQAQSFLAAKNYAAARAEALQVISPTDGDAKFNSDASQFIASLPANANSPANPSPASSTAAGSAPPASSAAQPVSPPAPPPVDYKPLVESITAALNQSQWDDAESKLRSLPPDNPQYATLKQRITDGRDDQIFTQKKSEFTQAETTKNESALRNSRDYFNTLAGQPGRHSSEARTLTTQIDSDLKTRTPANAQPSTLAAPSNSNPSGSPSNGSAAVSSTNNDVAAIRAVLDAYAKALDSGDLAALKSVRQIAPKDEKRYSDALTANKGKGFALLNCTSPEIRGDSATVACDTTLTRSRNASNGHSTLLLNRLANRWIITSTN